ncbi:MAG: hypothetical protein M5R42_01360 [Rhodocyclaceae bacterium]|nr:hypothetical protein [Rhodocyclaceae bacterium]
MIYLNEIGANRVADAGYVRPIPGSPARVTRRHVKMIGAQSQPCENIAKHYLNRGMPLLDPRRKAISA